MKIDTTATIAYLARENRMLREELAISKCIITDLIFGGLANGNSNGTIHIYRRRTTSDISENTSAGTPKGTQDANTDTSNKTIWNNRPSDSNKTTPPKWFQDLNEL